MTKLSFFLITIIFTTLVSCKKRSGTMTVIKDCTGSYLRFNELDYPICNIESVKIFNSGTLVSAEFFKIGTGKCEDKDAMHCAMLHHYQIGEWVNVTKIK